jgi:hypothetical protein
MRRQLSLISISNNNKMYYFHTWQIGTGAGILQSKSFRKVIIIIFIYSHNTRQKGTGIGKPKTAAL